MVKTRHSSTRSRGSGNVTQNVHVTVKTQQEPPRRRRKRRSGKKSSRMTAMKHAAAEELMETLMQGGAAPPTPPVASTTPAIAGLEGNVASLERMMMQAMAAGNNPAADAAAAAAAPAAPARELPEVRVPLRHPRPSASSRRHRARSLSPPPRSRSRERSPSTAERQRHQFEHHQRLYNDEHHQPLGMGGAAMASVPRGAFRDPPSFRDDPSPRRPLFNNVLTPNRSFDEHAERGRSLRSASSAATPPVREAVALPASSGGGAARPKLETAWRAWSARERGKWRGNMAGRKIAWEEYKRDNGY